MEDAKLALELTGFETVYLTDAVKNGDLAEGLDDREARIPLARELLLLLGSAYVELVHEDHVEAGPVEVLVTENQAWLLRSKVTTGAMASDNQTHIGIPLLRKLYSLLLQFHSGLEVWTVAEDRSAGEVNEKLQEYLDANRSAD